MVPANEGDMILQDEGLCDGMEMEDLVRFQFAFILSHDEECLSRFAQQGAG